MSCFCREYVVYKHHQGHDARGKFLSNVSGQFFHQQASRYDTGPMTDLKNRNFHFKWIDYLKKKKFYFVFPFDTFMIQPRHSS